MIAGSLGVLRAKTPQDHASSESFAGASALVGWLISGRGTVGAEAQTAHIFGAGRALRTDHRKTLQMADTQKIHCRVLCGDPPTPPSWAYMPGNVRVPSVRGRPIRTNGLEPNKATCHQETRRRELAKDLRPQTAAVTQQP